MSQIVPQLGCPIVVHFLTKNGPGSRDICTHPLIVTVWPTCPILSNLERFIPWNFPPQKLPSWWTSRCLFLVKIRKPPQKNGGFGKSSKLGDFKPYPILYSNSYLNANHMTYQHSLGHFGVGITWLAQKGNQLTLGNSPQPLQLVTLSWWKHGEIFGFTKSPETAVMLAGSPGKGSSHIYIPPNGFFVRNHRLKSAGRGRGYALVRSSVWRIHVGFTEDLMTTWKS